MQSSLKEYPTHTDPICDFKKYGAKYSLVEVHSGLYIFFIIIYIFYFWLDLFCILDC